jgi:hypothetical protein
MKKKYVEKVDFVAYEVIEPKGLKPTDQYDFMKKNNLESVH